MQQVNAADVLAALESYNRTIAEGSKLPYLERLIVVGTVAENAEDLHHKLITEIVGGKPLAPELEPFLAQIAKDDRLAAARHMAGSWAKAATKSARNYVLANGAAALVAAAISAVLVFTGFFRDLGETAGAALAAALVIAAAIASRYPPLARAAFYGVRALGGVGGEAKEGLAAALSALTGVGDAASGVLKSHLWPVISARFPQASGGRSTPALVRNVAQVFAILVACAAAVALIFFLIGFAQAFSAASQSPTGPLIPGG